MSRRGDNDFEDFLVASVNEALEQAFDSSTAQAVKFYIDTSILVRNPDAYSDSVMKMFGKEGGEVVINSIMKSLSRRANMPPDKKWSSLRECILAVAKSYRM